MLNNTQENIVMINQNDNHLIVMTRKIEFLNDMEIKTIDYALYKVFDNLAAFDVRSRIATASINKEKKFSAFLDNVAVINNERNSGYGTIIMERLLTDASILKISLIFGEIYEGDINTQDKKDRFEHFYNKLGFKIDFEKMKLYKYFN